MNNDEHKFDFDFLFLVIVSVCVFGAFYYQKAHAKEGRTVHLSSSEIAGIRITPGRSTVLSFPTKPTRVILGSQGAFGIEYVDQDVAINALRAGAASNLFVYVEGRRFGFDLFSVPTGGDELIFVRDAIESRSGKRPSHD